ncbi:MAG: HlyD family efflux transporter periplasmic adaptor subunit [bacterium]|nr:HlyD family efflux transporter periplasmic adaptor subunit [bacterium]
MNSPQPNAFTDFAFSFETASQTACTWPATESVLTSGDEPLALENCQAIQCSESLVNVAPHIEKQIEDLIDGTAQIIVADQSECSDHQHSLAAEGTAPVTEAPSKLQTAAGPEKSSLASHASACNERQAGTAPTSSPDFANVHPLEELKSSFVKLGTKESDVASYLKAAVRTLSRFHRLAGFGVWGRKDGDNFSDYASAKGLFAEHDKQLLREAVVHCLRVSHGKNKTLLFGPVQTARQSLHLVSIDIKRVPYHNLVITFAFAVHDEQASDLASLHSQLRTSVRLMLEHLPRLESFPESGSSPASQALKDSSESVCDKETTKACTSPAVTGDPTASPTAPLRNESLAEALTQTDPASTDPASAHSSARFRDAFSTVLMLRSLLFDFPIASALQRTVRLPNTANHREPTPPAAAEMPVPVEAEIQTEPESAADDHVLAAPISEMPCSQNQTSEVPKEPKQTNWWPTSLSARLGLLFILSAAGILFLGWMPYKHVSHANLVPSEIRELAAPMDMKFLEALVQPGDRVRAGQLLARFECPALDEQRRVLIGDLEQATERMRVAQREQNDQAEAESQIAISNLRSQLAELTQTLSTCNVRAPVDGYVLESNLSGRVNHDIPTGEPLIKLVPLGAYHLQLCVNEQQRGALAVHQSGTFTCGFPTWQELSYTIHNISQETETQSGETTYLVEATLDAGEQLKKLRPDSQGTARTNTGWQPLPWILLQGW